MKTRRLLLLALVALGVQYIAIAQNDDMYFVPKTSGVLAVNFNVYDGNDSLLANASINLIVPGEEETRTTFVDVPQDSYYYKAVYWALDEKLTTGMDETHFDPDGTVTRGQAITFLYRMSGSPTMGDDAVNTMEDVSAADWYYDAVRWAVYNGVSNGTDATHFSPGNPVTKEQMLALLSRIDGVNATGPSWAQVALAWATGKSLLEGIPGTFIGPSACTRADVIYYIWRYIA